MTTQVQPGRHDLSHAESRDERRERYGVLARAMIELAWRDARPDSRAPRAVAEAARAFLFSEAAEFWAEVAGFDLPRLRGRMKRETDVVSSPRNALPSRSES